MPRRAPVPAADLDLETLTLHQDGRVLTARFDDPPNQFLSLRLVKDKTGENLIPVVEVMRSTSTIQACIREGRLDEIEKHIENGRSQYQMQTLDQHLVQLCQKDIITFEEAKRVTRSTDLERKLTFTNEY